MYRNKVSSAGGSGGDTFTTHLRHIYDTSGQPPPDKTLSLYTPVYKNNCCLHVQKGRGLSWGHWGDCEAPPLREAPECVKLRPQAKMPVIRFGGGQGQCLTFVWILKNLTQHFPILSKHLPESQDLELVCQIFFDAVEKYTDWTPLEGPIITP